MSFLKKIFSNFFVLGSLVFLSGLISVYDNVMNVVFYKDLPLIEKNPFASWVIEKVGVSGLVEIKACGTMLAVSLMLLLAKTKYKVVIIPVFIFQLALFCYLSFYTPTSAGFSEPDFFRVLQVFVEFYQGKHTP